MKRILAVLAFLFGVSLPALPQSASVPVQPTKPKPYAPKIAAASDEPQLAQSRMTVPEGLELRLWAAEPLLANPVAFCFDEKGRCYVAETHRLHKGVIDIRGYMKWLDDDLACRTVADRLAFMKKKWGKEFAKATDHSDRVIRLADTKGLGKADESLVVSDAFRTPETGLGAGLLARGDDLWYTNIPHLWKLKVGPDGAAKEQTELHTGYGVHFGFIGHDLHGLTMGPDGKLYFSIGDRGAHIDSPHGKVNNPDSGAVFRCNPDGGELELFATGLRNPQELAFDEFGNLFTVDNNCDAGDQARVTYVIDGGDYGWRIGWQFFEQPRPRAAWMSEGMWQPDAHQRNAHIVPPIANLTSGPSGLVRYPGVGLPKKYDGSFFVCDFHGGSKGSGILRFKLEPQGAGFKVKEHEKFLWNVLATDVDFGPDGAMYALDWTEGWDMPGKGRVWRLADPNAKSTLGAETLADLPRKESNELARLLAHENQRVRQEAQLALAARALGLHGMADPEALTRLTSAAASAELPAVRAQALLALARIAKSSPDHAAGLIGGLSDPDPNVRGVAARGIGEAAVKSAAEKLLPLLSDPSPRVRFFACQALGKLQHMPAVPAILKALEENDDRDPYLRAAGCIALARIEDRPALYAAIKHKSPVVRRAACIALRRLGDAEIANLLQDQDPSIVKEAARAICDVPIPQGYGQLARLPLASGLELTQHAILQANFLLGKKENAEKVADAARDDALPELVRYEALEMLGAWAKPNGKDRFTGLWRPLPERDAALARDAFGQLKPQATQSPERVVRRTVRLCAQLNIAGADGLLAAMLKDGRRPQAVREECLKSLIALKSPELPEAVAGLLKDKEPKLRAAAQAAFAGMDPEKALPLLAEALDAESLAERQSAYAALGQLSGDAATKLLREKFQLLLDGHLPPECWLDATEAFRKRDCPDKAKLLAQRHGQLERQNKELSAWLDCLHGGDAERGRQVFLKQELTCLKCHKMEKEGGDVGPDLTHIAKDKSREYLLESVVKPNAQIAKGFDSLVLLTSDGKMLSGVLKSEDAKVVRLMNAEGEKAKEIIVPKDKIEQRQTGKSAMPEDLVPKMSLRELRDLVEFLATRK